MTGTDPNYLYELFAATIQPDENQRKQAESHLKEVHYAHLNLIL